MDSSFTRGHVDAVADGQPRRRDLQSRHHAAVNGVAVFDGLSMSQPRQRLPVHGPGLRHQRLIEFPDDQHLQYRRPAAGGANVLPGADLCEPEHGDQYCRQRRNANDTIMLEAGIYALNASTPGQFVIQDTSASVSSKTITIVGAGPGLTVIEPSDSKGWDNRIFEVVSNSGAAVTVIFQNLTIAGRPGDRQWDPRRHVSHGRWRC